MMKGLAMLAFVMVLVLVSGCSTLQNVQLLQSEEKDISEINYVIEQFIISLNYVDSETLVPLLAPELLPETDDVLEGMNEDLVDKGIGFEYVLDKTEVALANSSNASAKAWITANLFKDKKSGGMRNVLLLSFREIDGKWKLSNVQEYGTPVYFGDFMEISEYLVQDYEVTEEVFSESGELISEKNYKEQRYEERPAHIGDSVGKVLVTELKCVNDNLVNKAIITGTVTNTGSYNYNSDEVYVAVDLKRDNMVVSTQYTYVQTGRLAPDETSDFEIVMWDNPDWTDCTVYTRKV